TEVDQSIAADAPPAHDVRVKTRKTVRPVGLVAPPSSTSPQPPTTRVNQRPTARAIISFSTQSADSGRSRPRLILRRCGNGPPPERLAGCCPPVALSAGGLASGKP